MLGLIVGATAGLAQTSTPRVRVEQPWARATAGSGLNGVVYMTLTNTGEATDRLLAAASPVAARAEFHSHIDDDGVMRMRKADAVDLKPGEPVVLKPGGLHVMLVGLKAPLREGENFSLALTFEAGGTVQVTVRVEKLGALEPLQ